MPKKKTVSSSVDSTFLDQAVETLEEHGYSVKEWIGSGSYGTVVRVEKRGCTYAAKITPKQLSSAGELEMWPSLSHPNILDLVQIITCEKAYIFVTLYLPTTLDKFLVVCKKQENMFDVAVSWIRDFLGAAQYLHERGMCHLDLKLDNVLLADDLRAVLCDYTSLSPYSESTSK